MRMTVVVDTAGKLVAAMQGETPRPDTSAIAQGVDPRAGIVAGPGQVVRVVDVPDAIVALPLAQGFHEKLQAHLATLPSL